MLLGWHQRCHYTECCHAKSAVKPSGALESRHTSPPQRKNGRSTIQIASIRMRTLNSASKNMLTTVSVELDSSASLILPASDSRSPPSCSSLPPTSNTGPTSMRPTLSSPSARPMSLSIECLKSFASGLQKISNMQRGSPASHITRVSASSSG